MVSLGKLTIFACLLLFSSLLTPQFVPIEIPSLQIRQNFQSLLNPTVFTLIGNELLPAYPAKLLAVRQVARPDHAIWGQQMLDRGKVTATAKDQIIYAYQVNNGNDSLVEIYSLSGETLSIAASDSFKVTGKPTRASAVRYQNGQKFAVAGDYFGTGYKEYPFMGTYTYSSNALQGPSLYSFSPMTVSWVSKLDVADVTADNAYDYIMAIGEASGTAGDYNTRLTVRTLSKTYTKLLEKDYGLVEIMDIRAGDFSSAAGKEIAFVATDTDFNTDLYLLKVEGSSLNLLSSKLSIKSASGKGLFSPRAMAANLDSDPLDELVIVGAYDKADNFAQYADMVQIYDYTASGWVRKAESINTIGGDSLGLFSYMEDVNNDGKDEIIVIFQNLYNQQGQNDKTIRAKANVYGYSGTGSMQLLSSASIQPLSPSPQNSYDPITATSGDFDNDGWEDFALLYKDKSVNQHKLAVYSLRGDSTPPTVSVKLANPNANYTNAMEVIAMVNASDSSGISSGRLKLTNTKGYNSGWSNLSSQISNGKLIANMGFNLVGKNSGTYTFTAEATDKFGNTANAKVTFAVSQASQPAAPPAPGVDITGPTLHVNTDKASYNQGAIAAVVVTASDNVAFGNPNAFDDQLVKIEVYSSDNVMVGQYYLMESGKATNLFTYALDIGQLPAGTYDLQTVAFDNAGNMGYDETSFTVVAGSQPEEEEQPPAEEPAGCTLTAASCSGGTVLDADNCVCIPAGQPAPCPLTASSCGAGLAFNADLCQCIQIPPGCPLTASSCAQGTELDASLCQCVNTQTPEEEPQAPPTQPPAGPQTPPTGGSPVTPGSSPSEAQEQAENLLLELDVKIAVADSQDVPVLAAKQSYDKATALQQQGKYVEAALEAQKGVFSVNEALKNQPTPYPRANVPPCPIAFVVGALMVIGFAISVRKK